MGSTPAINGKRWSISIRPMKKARSQCALISRACPKRRHQRHRGELATSSLKDAAALMRARGELQDYVWFGDGRQHPVGDSLLWAIVSPKTFSNILIISGEYHII